MPIACLLKAACFYALLWNKWSASHGSYNNIPIIYLLFLCGAHLWDSGSSQVGLRLISLFISTGCFTSSPSCSVCAWFRPTMFKLCCIYMDSFHCFPSDGSFSFHKAFHIDVLSYPVLCPVPLCCPWLLPHCSPEWAEFLHDNFFFFLPCWFFLTTYFLLYSPESCLLFCFVLFSLCLVYTDFLEDA